MEVPNSRSSALASTIRWAARILCILAVVLIGLWSGEAVEGKVGLGRQILAVLMAPPFILSVVLIITLVIAWKHELVGGILLAFIGLATAASTQLFAYSRRFHMASQGLRAGSPNRQVLTFFLISLPLIVPGVLFIISYLLHRPKKPTTQTP